MVVDFKASKKTVDELGADGLDELATHLWPVDCQTCGRPLGTKAPALVVSDLIVSASASLHHRRCRRPEWNDSGQINMSGADMLSYLTRVLMGPFPPTRAGGAPFEMRPMLLVNPTLEQVMLRRGLDERWRVATVEFYTGLGLCRPGADLSRLDLTHPVAGVRGRLTGGKLSVGFDHAVWGAPLEPAFAARVRELGGIVLAVTTRVHPGQLEDLEPFVTAVATEQVAMGWIAVDTGGGPSSADLEQLVGSAAAAAPLNSEGVPDLVAYSGSTYDPATGRFELGVGAGDKRFYWVLHTPGRGMEHGLIAGPPRSGRTNSLRLVLAEAVQAPHFTFMVADPLDRNGLCDLFGPAAEMVARNFGQTLDLLAAAVRIVDARLGAGGYTDPTPGHPAILIVIDDAEAVLRNKRAAALAAQIVARGGPAGVGLVVATNTVDPADFAGNTELLRGLSATNAFPMDLEFFHFLQALRSQPTDS